MDERRNNGFENRPNNSSGFDSYNRNPNGNGDFKVNISDFEGIPDVERRPKRPVQRANAPRQEDFRVTLPNRQPKRSAAPVGRPAGAGTAKSPAARSSAKNRPAASAGTRTRKPLSPEQIKRNKEKRNMKRQGARRLFASALCSSRYSRLFYLRLRSPQSATYLRSAITARRPFLLLFPKTPISTRFFQFFATISL